MQNQYEMALNVCTGKSIFKAHFRFMKEKCLLEQDKVSTGDVRDSCMGHELFHDDDRMWHGKFKASLTSVAIPK